MIVPFSATTLITLVQSGIIVAVFTLAGVIIKGVFDKQSIRIDDKSKFLASVIDEVKSLREEAIVTDNRLDQMGIRLQQAQEALADCVNAREDLKRQIKELQARILSLEAQIASFKRMPGHHEMP